MFPVGKKFYMGGFTLNIDLKQNMLFYSLCFFLKVPDVVEQPSVTHRYNS